MISVSDAVKRVQDLLGNYTTGTPVEGQVIRAIDYSMNVLKKTIAFPQDEKVFTFQFMQDVMYYDLPANLMETFGLYYSDNNYNLPFNQWSYRAETDIRRISGSGTGNFYSHVTINGNHQLMTLARNLRQGTTVDSFDTVLWTPSGDASNIAFDTNVKIQGAASQSFTITDSTHVATLYHSGYNFNGLPMVSGNGRFRYYLYMPSDNIDSINLRYGTDNSNYNTITITEQADGTAFAANDWNLLSFDVADRQLTGSPDDSNITFFETNLDLGPGFGTVPGFRIDWLYTIFPDQLDLWYHSRAKGEDKDGNEINVISAVTDVLPYDEEYVELISLKAALYLGPQYKLSPEMYAAYTAQMRELNTVFSRRWPRKANQNNYQNSRLRR